jgi:hypothetical protein
MPPSSPPFAHPTHKHQLAVASRVGQQTLSARGRRERQGELETKSLRARHSTHCWKNKKFVAVKPLSAPNRLDIMEDRVRGGRREQAVKGERPVLL